MVFGLPLKNSVRSA